MKHDDPKVKEEMVAVKYRPEQDLTRMAGIEACKQHNVVVELYAGMGGSTKLFKRYFKQVISNDINPKSVAEFNMTAMKFIQTKLQPNDAGWGANGKIDLIDFDCYGCPSEEIKEFFKVREKRDMPLVVTVSDGLGIWMKRSKNIARLRERYLLPDYFQFDERHPWRQHKTLLNRMMTELAIMYGLKVDEKIIVQTKHMNYVLGAWLFTNQ